MYIDGKGPQSAKPIHENRPIARQAIVKLQTMRDSEKTLKAFGVCGGVENRTPGVRMISYFSKKATLDTRKPWTKHSKFRERMIFLCVARILCTSKPLIKTVSEMQKFKNFNSCLPLGVFLQN